jgi:hypothetical protein
MDKKLNHPPMANDDYFDKISPRFRDFRFV